MTKLISFQRGVKQVVQKNTKVGKEKSPQMRSDASKVLQILQLVGGFTKRPRASLSLYFT